MKTYVILLRSVNVGGKNILPMKELVKLLEGQGYRNVRSYLQTGNIVLNARSISSAKLTGIINDYFGIAPEIFVMEQSAFGQIIARNPFLDHEGKLVHLFFCNKKPTLNVDLLEKYVIDSEEYKLVDKVFYLFAPDGIGRSKLVANIEPCLGVSATGRNLNTVNKLSHMLGND